MLWEFPSFETVEFGLQMYCSIKEWLPFISNQIKWFITKFVI